MKKIGAENAINKVFKGTLSNEVLGKCSLKSEREEEYIYFIIIFFMEIIY